MLDRSDFTIFQAWVCVLRQISLRSIAVIARIVRLLCGESKRNLLLRLGERMRSVVWLRLMQNRTRFLPCILSKVVLCGDYGFGIEVTAFSELLVDRLFQMVFSISSLALHVLTEVVTMGARSGVGNFRCSMSGIFQRRQRLFLRLVLRYLCKCRGWSQSHELLLLLLEHLRLQLLLLHLHLNHEIVLCQWRMREVLAGSPAKWRVWRDKTAEVRSAWG